MTLTSVTSLVILFPKRFWKPQNTPTSFVILSFFANTPVFFTTHCNYIIAHSLAQKSSKNLFPSQEKKQFSSPPHTKKKTIPPKKTRKNRGPNFFRKPPLPFGLPNRQATQLQGRLTTIDQEMTQKSFLRRRNGKFREETYFLSG